MEEAVLKEHGPAMGAFGFAVYCVLAKHADATGRCYPSQARIAAMLNLSRPTVATNLRLLCGLGLVRIVSKERNKVTVYQLVGNLYEKAPL